MNDVLKAVLIVGGGLGLTWAVKQSVKREVRRTIARKLFSLGLGD